MRFLKIYICAICLLIVGCLSSQDMTSKADELVAGSIENNEHALSVLVAKGDKIVYQKTVGYANVKSKTLADNQTKFRIGSVTKQFYASAILKLVEEGKMSLDDPLSKYIKDFPKGDKVKIHHLLTHTSGIKSYTDQSDFIVGVTKPIKLDDLINKIKTLGYDFEPGESWKYNNSAYAIVGYLVEKVSKMPADKYLSKYVFEPSQMTNTGIYKNNKKYKNEALGYAYINDEVKLSLDWDMSWAGGAGNLYSTADDLLQWNRKIFKGEIINKESLKKAHSKVKLNDGSDYPYGFGWGLGEYKGLKIIAHSGGLHGFLTNLAYYPEIDATIAVLSNCSPPKKIVPGNFTEKLADIFFEEHLTENQEVVVDVLKLHKYVGKYVYPGGAIMEITNENNQLMAQLTGQPKHPIYPKSENVFFWKIVDAEITFHTDEEGKVDYGMHKQNGFENKVPKYSEPEEVSFNPSDFEPFVGEYAMGPAVVNVWVENEVFYVQITGQPKFQIFPKSKTRFFLKAVQAEIEFNNSKTPAPAFTLFQGGNEVKAVRK